MNLWDYQEQARTDLQSRIKAGNKRIVMAIPTGGGKTVIACDIALRAKEKGNRVLFIVHLKTLIVQAVRHFRDAGLSVGIMQGENTCYSKDDDIIVASIQTIRARRAPEWAKIIIIDECHILHKAHIELLEKWNNLFFIGMTATPLRRDLGVYFQSLVRGPSPKELIERGRLVKSRAMSPDAEAMEALFMDCPTRNTPYGRDYNQADMARIIREAPKMVGNVTRKWLEMARERKTLIFAADKATSRHLVGEFENCGIKAAHIEDRTPGPMRSRVFDAFKSGELRIVSSVGITTIGFDQPDVSCLILARKTMSETLHWQMLGRGIRASDKKEDCLILDFVGNVRMLGLPHEYQIPDSLPTGQVSSGSKEHRKACKTVCKECGLVLDKGVRQCDNCGTDIRLYSRPPEEVSGDLVEYELEAKEEKEVISHKNRDLETDYRMLLWHARFLKFKTGWAYKACKEKHRNAYIPWDWQRKTPLMPDASMISWIKYYRIRKAKSAKKKERLQVIKEVFEKQRNIV